LGKILAILTNVMLFIGNLPDKNTLAYIGKKLLQDCHQIIIDTN